jgi:hypothetical protein
LNGYSGLYVVTGIHPTAAIMNGNKRETSDAIRYGLNVALAVSKTVKAGQPISSYPANLTALDIQHQELMNSNVLWIDSTWGPGSSVQAKDRIFSILHLDLSPMKLNQLQKNILRICNIYSKSVLLVLSQKTYLNLHYNSSPICNLLV